MNHDPEGSVRDLLHATDHQPALLNPHQVIAAGQRRLRRQRLAPVVAVAAVAVLGAGVAVRELHRPGDVAQTVALAPGGWQRLTVATTTFEVAVRSLGTPGVGLIVTTVDQSGVRRDVLRVPDVDTDPTDPATGMFTSQYPTLQFAVFPAGSREITASFSSQTAHETATAVVEGSDQHQYVVVVVSTATYDDATRLNGFTWLDADGRSHEYPLG
jgi:hypothetical protein